MMKKYILIALPSLFLSGCIGTWISGKTGNIFEDYPDIRTVPERKEATAPRDTHQGDEKAERSAEFKSLQDAKEKIKARDEAIREGAFPAEPQP